MITEQKILLQNAGRIDPYSIDDYLKQGGYMALKDALQRSPNDLLNLIEQSGLKGRGGAGFPTGIKTQATSGAEAVCLRYVVCNADEGEPGTFKDRAIMENDPHLLIEGMLIAAASIGASQGYIYIRAEYYLSIEILQTAIIQAYDRNFLGKNIIGSNFSFDLELLPGAGSYLCGEELTLLESLEGKRGYPRIKPPFPAEKGLWQQPTLVNNVETLANLPIILRIGSDEYIKLGTADSPGTKLICLSGDIQRPGTYEVKMGTNISDIICDLGGGVPEKRYLKTVLLGGAAGTFASVDQLNIPLGFSELRRHNLTLGSGAMIVFSDQNSMKKTLASIFEFFKHESCGKCIPCRLGTAHITEIWNQAMKETTERRKSALKEIEKISEDMAASSLCPLGQSPILPVKSFIANCIELLD
jgi:NADP-reducing hydrogenase subunit HndC